MVGGVFLLSLDPESLAAWYERHLGWKLAFLPDEGFYTELYFREDDDAEQRRHLVFAIMPGDPGDGDGHIINYRVDDLEAVVGALRTEGVDVSSIEVGPDAQGEGKFARLRDPEGHRIELWQHL